MMESEDRVLASSRSLILDLPPSCIEFCPAHPSHFVVGTYNLQKEETTTVDQDAGSDNRDEDQNVKKPQSRNGSLVVFRLADDTHELSLVQTLSYPSALLDLHFHPHPDKHEVMATVSSTGSLSFFRLSPTQSSSVLLVELVTCKPLGNDDTVLLLSCAWHPSRSDLLAVTTSDFQVHILRIDEEWNAHETSSSPVIMHTLEAWTVAFSPFISKHQDETNDSVPLGSDEIVIYSGGDDSKLLSTTCYYHDDLKVNSEDSGDSLSIIHPLVTIKGHMAGVTAILPLPLTNVDGSRVVSTGSYDDTFRIYSIHPQVGGIMARPPKLLADENLGGGVWRLKLVKLDDPRKENNDDTASRQYRWSALILASCMHAGCRILEITGDYSDNCQITVLARFEEHQSMNYGSDFQPGTERDSRTLRCVSTSFYDRLLCLWEF
ncbi:hypothetical protein F4808DRAFT_435314 [Astrocystis sublimbata]|nr:hypothetical protein F4808DRAFT_435314 [Astrocystis sublimbata]